MIRTRDFLLYMMTLVFLVSAIGFTAVSDTATRGVAKEMASTTVAVAQSASVYTAATVNTTSDKEDYIQAMRDKIAEGAGVREDAPIVFTSVDTPTDEELQNTARGERVVQWCETPKDITNIISKWDADTTTLETVEGAQLVMRASADDENVSLLQLPALQTRNAYDTCLSHEVVGISLSGELIYNDNASQFYSAEEETLIGYALDGFPIYGPRGDESLLDTCGGLSDTGSYRYHVRMSEDFVLGCFAGTPTDLITE